MNKGAVRLLSVKQKIGGAAEGLNTSATSTGPIPTTPYRAEYNKILELTSDLEEVTVKLNSRLGVILSQPAEVGNASSESESDNPESNDSGAVKDLQFVKSKLESVVVALRDINSRIQL